MWKFWKSKTVWAAGFSGAIGLSLFAAGQMDTADLLEFGSLCLLAVFLRHAVSKAEL